MAGILNCCGSVALKSVSFSWAALAPKKPADSASVLYMLIDELSRFTASKLGIRLELSW